jgi:hypothetical protein
MNHALDGIRLFRWFFLLAVSLIAIGCSTTDAGNTTASSSSYPSPASTPRQPTLDEEANKVARDYWNNLLSKCGDSYFWLETGSGMGTARVFEAKDPMTVKVTGSAPQKRELSRAEQLNQTASPQEQWTGKTWVEFDVWRYGDYYSGKVYQWIPWKDKRSTADKQRLEEMKKYMPPGTYESMQATTQAQVRADMKKVNNEWQLQPWGITHPLQKIDCAQVNSIR